MVLQTHALTSGIIAGEHSARRSGLPWPYDLTLTLSWGCSDFRPQRPGSLAMETGHPILQTQDSGCHPRGDRIRWPCAKPSCPEKYPCPGKPPKPSVDTHTTIPDADGPPEQCPPLRPPRSLSLHWHIRPTDLPGPNPLPRLAFQALHPRGVTPNPSHG